MAMLPSDIKRLQMAALDGAMYPGVQWDLNAKAFRRLQVLGYVRLFTPHNQVHKDRAVITQAGREALEAVEGRKRD